MTKLVECPPPGGPVTSLCLTCQLAGLPSCPALIGGQAIVAAKLVENRRLDVPAAVKLMRSIESDRRPGRSPLIYPATWPPKRP